MKHTNTYAIPGLIGVISPLAALLGYAPARAATPVAIDIAPGDPVISGGQIHIFIAAAGSVRNLEGRKR